jgi:hypothetical protein
MKPGNLLLLGLGLLLPNRLDLWAQPVPHHFSGLTVLADRTVALSLEGSVSNMFTLPAAVSDQFSQMFDLYVVEASTNLAEWTRLDWLLRTNDNPNPLPFLDTNAPGFSHRFYRTFTNHLITGFPKPTGPFAVGTISRILTDSSRTNRYGMPTNSSFMSTFWYPAQPSGAGTFPGPYTDRAVAGDQNFYSFWSCAPEWTNVVPHCVAHSVPAAPLASGTNRFPVILHSHGWTCDRTLNSQTAAELASHGYIVAAVDHEDCHATVFPDERGVRYVPPGSSYAAVSSRQKDLQCLLDELVLIDQSDPLLAGHLALDHIGVMGFSMGGGTAAEIGRLDSRVKCAALLDAWIYAPFYPDLSSQGLQKPFLAINRSIPNDHGFGDFSPWSTNLYNLATTNATWLKIANTRHFAFSDFAWLVEMTNYSRQGAVAINACLLWCFDTHLKGEAPPFPTNPEVIDIHRK